MLTRAQAKTITDKALSLSKADEAFVSLSDGTTAHLRFARNTPSTSGIYGELSLTVTSSFGTRSAKASTTEQEPEAIEAAIRRSEELARIAPEDPEWVPLLEPQQCDRHTPAFDDATAQFPP